MEHRSSKDFILYQYKILLNNGNSVLFMYINVIIEIFISDILRL